LQFYQLAYIRYSAVGFACGWRQITEFSMTSRFYLCLAEKITARIS
jgi:hypothetical protein